MKIALLTISRVRNFGAEMQCYATVRALRELGHHVDVIDYRLFDENATSLKSMFAKMLIAASPDSRSFNAFWKNYIPYTCHCEGRGQLEELAQGYDLFLTGSDQIWNPDITEDKWPTYFLDFLKDNEKRCAYASSFGEDAWKWPEIKDEVQGLLEKFQAIAVREESGKRLLERDFGIEAEVVLDPTLLHQNYDEIVAVDQETPTLAYYPLVDNAELEAFSRELAAELGLKFINTNTKMRLLGKIVWQRTSIQDWIRNIGEASMVVTPSFHGLAFSLIYGKQFIIVQNQGKSRSSRITGLLEKLDLSDRYFTSIEDAKESRVWERPIDYTEVNKRLNQLRDKSWEYLKKITFE